jgi:hypothetical protein
LINFEQNWHVFYEIPSFNQLNQYPSCSYFILNQRQNSCIGLLKHENFKIDFLQISFSQTNPELKFSGFLPFIPYSLRKTDRYRIFIIQESLSTNKQEWVQYLSNLKLEIIAQKYEPRKFLHYSKYIEIYLCLWSLLMALNCFEPNLIPLNK